MVTTDQIDHLKSGHWYRFDHRRKGAFFGRFVSTVGNYEDPTDPLLLAVQLWTEDGSGQERYANCFEIGADGVKRRPKFSSKLIRSSLLNGIMTPGSKEQERFREIEKDRPRPMPMPEVEADHEWGHPVLVSAEKRPWWKSLFGGG